jgi:hypothetical protein
MPLPEGFPPDSATARRTTDGAVAAFRDEVTSDDGTVDTPHRAADAALADLAPLRRDVDGLPHATPGVAQDGPTLEATSAAFDRCSDILETLIGSLDRP